MKWNRRDIAGAVARYLRIGEAWTPPVPSPVLVEQDDGVGGHRGAIARYLGIGESRPGRVISVSSVEHEVRPRTVDKPSRPKTRPVRRRKPSAARLPDRSPRVLRCYDCEGEIQPTWDQCPHCALFLDTAS